MAADTVNSALASTSVKLLIKASNQEVEDQIIDTQLLWTVRRLKTHLSQVYPCNPSISEQKLIYSGQLLADNLLLKDVIRNYKDVDTQNHIFHLVYTPRNPGKKSFSMAQQSAPNFSYENDKPSTSKAATNSSDGLRHRNVGGSVGGTTTTADRQYSQVQQQRQHEQQKQQSNSNMYKNSTQNSGHQPGPAAPSNDNKSKSYVDIPEIMSNGKYPQYYHQPQNPNALQFVIPTQLEISAMIAHRDAMYNWLQKVYNQYQEQCLLLAKLPSYAQNYSTGSTPTASSPIDGAEVAASAEASSLTSPLSPPKGSNAQPFMAASNSYLPQQFFQQMPFFMQNISSFGGFFPGMNSLATDFSGSNSSPSTTTVGGGGSSGGDPAAATAARVSSSSPSSSSHSASTGTNPIQAVPVIQSTTTNTTTTTPTTTAASDQTQFSAQAEQQQAAAEAAEPAAAGVGVGGGAAAQQIPRFPNIVEEDQDNRDWLDNFYSAIRLLALLTLVYVYSSPMRCLVVAVIAIGIYLYHNGFLNIRRPTEANNNNINDNRNNNPGANQIRQGVHEVQQHQQQEQQQQQNQSTSSQTNENIQSVTASAAATTEAVVANNRREAQTSPTSSSAVPDRENNTNSAVAFVQTFVVSFFTSLLPETAAL